MRLLRVWAILLLALAGCRGDLTGEILSRIEGTVIEKQNGKPLKNAMVYFYRGIRQGGGGELYREIGPFYTDGNGHFKFDRLKAGDYVVCVYKQGYAQVGQFRMIYETKDREESMSPNTRIPLTSPHIIKLKQGEVKHLDIQLEKEAVLEVTVYRKTPSGSNVLESGDIESLLNPMGTKDYFLPYEDGQKAIYYGLQGGSDFKLEVYPPGYPEITKTVHLAKGETRKMDVVVDFTVGQTLFGVIYAKDSMAPIRGVSVRLHNGKGIFLTIHSDESGGYLFGGLEPGLYTLSLYHGASKKKFKTPIELNENQKKQYDIQF